MSKDIIWCTQNVILKHIVRATKLSYQKFENVRLKRACLVPSLTKNILAPRLAQDCLSYFHEYCTRIYSLFLVQLLIHVSSIVHYWRYSQHRFIDYLTESSMVLVGIISEYITVAHNWSWWDNFLWIKTVVQGKEKIKYCDESNKFNLSRTRTWNCYFTHAVVALSSS